MKRWLLSILIIPVLMITASQAQAYVSVRFGSGWRGGGWHGGGWHGRWYRPYYGGPSVIVAPGYYDPYYYDSYYYPPYYNAPVAVYPVPYYAPAPTAPSTNSNAAQPPASSDESAQQQGTPVPLTGDYGADLGTLHGKMAKLRTLLNRQKAKGGITAARYTQYTNELEAIESDEHSRSYKNNGRLTDQDLAELIGRTDEVNEEVQAALAE